MAKRISFFATLFFILLGVTACDKNGFYDHYQKVGKGWEKSDVKTFEVEQQDTLGVYNLFLNIRNNRDYPFSNLFVIVKIQQPNQILLVDTLEFQMADPNGLLLGSGFSDIKENKLWLKEGYIFPEKGVYKIQIEQAMREIGSVKGITELKGISEIGIRIEKEK